MDRDKTQRDAMGRPSLSRAFFDAIPDAMLICDLDGYIAYANLQAERLFGYSRAELLQMSVERLLPHRFRARHIDHRQRYMDDPQPRSMGIGLTLFCLTKTNTELPVEISLNTIQEGDDHWIAATIRDASSHLVLSKAKHAAEQADAAKSRFLAAASHDLRQPLQTLRLLNGVLMRTLHDDNNTIAVLNKQREALDAMSNLLSTLLDIHQLECGDIKPRCNNFCVKALLARIRATFTDQAAAKGLTLKVVQSSQVVFSDSSLLAQIINNLVSNAIKYTDQGKVLVGCRRQGRYLRIEIWDTGSGIVENQLRQIFEEFYQIDNSQHDNNRGLGLGLAIVERLSQLLGHSIDVRSVPGRGSVFTVVVPQAE